MCVCFFFQNCSFPARWSVGLLSPNACKLHVYVYERIITHTLPDWAVMYAKIRAYTKSVHGRFHTAKRGFFGGVTGERGVKHGVLHHKVEEVTVTHVLSGLSVGASVYTMFI